MMSMNSKIIEDCIVMRLKTWQFPLPQGGVDVKVSYPFVLRRAGQG
ncbi:MAG: AgmX/PglI C-terminal domain-containing protein [Proteobacteria bacterium]|nr:MAG: AgmX/PglI C-terminal domain-containing protein [Pseudomonadota bacterium]